MSDICVGQISTNSSGAAWEDIGISVIHWEKVTTPIVSRSHASGIFKGASVRTGKSGCHNPVRSFRWGWQGASPKALEVSWERRVRALIPWLKGEGNPGVEQGTLGRLCICKGAGVQKVKMQLCKKSEYWVTWWFEIPWTMWFLMRMCDWICHGMLWMQIFKQFYKPVHKFWEKTITDDFQVQMQPMRYKPQGLMLIKV